MNDVNSPTDMRSFTASTVAMYSTVASPSAVSVCTIGLLSDLVSISFMCERRLCSFTCSKVSAW